MNETTTRADRFTVTTQRDKFTDLTSQQVESLMQTATTWGTEATQFRVTKQS